LKVLAYRSAEPRLPSAIAALVLWMVEDEGAQLMTGETGVSSGGTLMR